MGQVPGFALVKSQQEMTSHECSVGSPGMEIIGQSAGKASNNSMQQLAGFTKTNEPVLRDSMSISTPTTTVAPWSW